MAAVPTSDPRTDRAHLVMSALAMVLAPVFLTIASFTNLSTSGKAAHEVAQIAAHRTQFVVGNAFFALGGAALIPAALGLMKLARARGAAWVTTGGCMLALGGGALAVAIWSYNVVGYLGTDSRVPRIGTIAIVDRGENSLLIGALWILGIGALIGMIVCAVGLLRARTVPRWMAILLIIAPVVTFFGNNGAIGGLLSLPLLVVFCALAYELYTMPRAEAAQPGVIDLNAMPEQRERVEPAATKEPTS